MGALQEIWNKRLYFKYDVRHFFDSIDHDVLKEMIKDIPDRNVLGLLYHIINSYAKDKNPVTGEEKGLPMGNQTSQWFALYYLDPLDSLIKEKMHIKHYVRYMDDGIMIHESKEYLNEVKKEMDIMADKLKIKFNAKTQIFPISEGVDFLGFRFYLTDTGKVIKRLRTSNKKRWKRRLKKFKREYREGTKTLEDVSRSIVSYNGHLSHGHTYKLKKKVMSKFVLTKSPENGGIIS